MTKEEIKATYTMRDVAARYGLIPNRSGFLPCPFHQGDREPSMKLYEKDYHCHACGAHGDIFDFVMEMDNLTFKEAFRLLGGEYEKASFASYLRINRERQQKDNIKRILALKKEEKRRACMMIEAYRGILQEEEPFSDLWCHCINGLQYQLYMLENLETG